jgi:quaternary ammonium compound-resistance protein SugE
MEKRYPALHIISLLFKVLSVVIVILGIVLIIIVLAQGEITPKVFGSTFLTLGVVPIILFTLISALILWGIAELLICLIDIENNTRITMTKLSQPKETPVTPAAVVTPSPIVTPTAQPAAAVKPEEESEEKKAAAALAARKQSFKDVLNKKLW